MPDQQTQPRGSIRAFPNPVTPEHGQEHAVVTLTWSTTGVEQIEIRIGAPDGSLLASGGATGSAITGQWVADWMTFFLQDVTAGQPLTTAHTLGTVCVRVTHGHARRRLDAHTNSERLRLEQLPPFEPTTTTILGAPFRIIDAPSFLEMYYEIIELGIYAFPSADDTPYVLDCGANVGVSVCYFKRQYPQARIVAFEPNADAFAALAQNALAFGWTDVTLVDKAVAPRQGPWPFVTEGSYGSRLARTDDMPTGTVSAVRLRDYLGEHVDLLKLDIEGAETAVLVDCEDVLHRVDRIVLEFHSFESEPQTLHVLCDLLAANGYRLYVRSVGSAWAPRPFVELPVHSGMDMQLMVYAFRP